MRCITCNVDLRNGDEVVVELSGIYDDDLDIESMLSEKELYFTGGIIHKKCEVAKKEA